MKTHTQWWSWAVVVVGLAFMLQAPLRAKAQDAQVAQDSQDQQDAQNANDQDPPGRVARLNYVEGSVSFQPGGENDWVTAVLNRPLMTGDNVWADENSRAEVHIGATALRLGAKTGITLLEVSDRAAQIRLAQGSLFVKVRHVGEEDSYEVDTPNIAFTIQQPGDYRIDVDPDGNRTEVTVWRGRGQVTGAGSSYTVVANQHASFTSTSTGNDQLADDFGQVPANDAFDSWALDRDQNEDRSDSGNYVSRDMTGYEDLDQYGDWSYVAGYGTVWSPRGLVAGWAPYRFGHWTWVGPWGWTWVADEPWGFAPFHYGRWAAGANGWIWVPGPRMARPAYAPALVGWVGGTPGFRFSAGVGVGWFPLGPGEVFVPGYRVSRAYVNRVNITNTTVNVTRVNNVYNAVVINRNSIGISYANRNVNGGVTVVSRDTFVNARPVARNVFSVPAAELAAAPASHMIAVEPERSSVLGTGRPVANRPPAVVMTRPVVALRTPAPMPRSFEQRQAKVGGQLSQSSSIGQSPTQQSVIHQSLVRQVAPRQPVSVPVTHQPLTQDGFHSVSMSSEGSNQAKPQPRVWEEQGTAQPEPSPQPENRNAQPAGSSRPARQGTQQRAQQGSNPQVKPVAAVQGAHAQPQRPASPPPAQKQPSPPASHQGSAPKK
jgi:hypothetical protein